MFLLFSLFSPTGLDFYVDEYVFNIQFNFIHLYELVHKSEFSRETTNRKYIHIYIYIYIYIYSRVCVCVCVCVCIERERDRERDLL